MKPSTSEILDGIGWILDERLAPITEDKWAASYLRSIKGLLRHLSVRADSEGDILWDDIAEQKRLLADVAQIETDHPVWTKLKENVQAVLETQWFDPDKYRSVAHLETESQAYNQQISQVIVALHDCPEGVSEEMQSTWHERVKIFLREQMLREEPLYKEPFKGRPF